MMTICTSANSHFFYLIGAVWRRQRGRATQSTQSTQWQRQPLWTIREPVGRQHALGPGGQRSLRCGAAQRLRAWPSRWGWRRWWRGPPVRWRKPGRQRDLWRRESSLWQGQYPFRQKVRQHTLRSCLIGITRDDARGGHDEYNRSFHINFFFLSKKKNPWHELGKVLYILLL